MSIQSMVWALEQQEIKDSTCRHVLLCLANYAGSDGRGAFPSALTLAVDTGLSERTVRYKLDALEAAGLIRRGNQSIAAAYIDRHDRRPVVYDLIEKRGAAAAPNTSSTRHLSVNKPKEGAAKSAGPRGKSDKFDPLTAKPANASEQAWADFCEMRKAKRAPLTLRACELIAKKLANHPEPDVVLDKSTTSSWSDIYPESVLPGAGAKAGNQQSAVLSVPTHRQEDYPSDRF